MKRIHKLAAEVFGYSYDNCSDHLGVNERSDRLMPGEASMLETAVRENWPAQTVAKHLGCDLDTAMVLLENTHVAL